MRKNRFWRIGIGIWLVNVFVLSGGIFAQDDFSVFCRVRFEKDNECPKEICSLKCEEDALDGGGSGCVSACVPKSCLEIPFSQCPAAFCSVVINCSGENMCYFLDERPPPSCGDLAYAGQDVPCCPGLVRRCGVEFFDGTCDLEGRNSVYSLPICIPCGDGYCTNFEDRCNCPEDCGGGDYQGVVFSVTSKETENIYSEEQHFTRDVSE